MTKDKEYQAALEMLETLTRLLGDDVQMVPLGFTTGQDNLKYVFETSIPIDLICDGNLSPSYFAI